MVKEGKPKQRSTPYRGGEARSEAKPDGEGLVDEIVRQFTDRYAFYRELVQNAIDAGASRVVVRLVHDADEQLVRISVTDDGSGMSQKILEEDLTVLFKSTKETRDDAIGKFGIGFVSVLALDPRLVAVDTSLGDGVRHRLELSPDHSYELLRSSGGERGTTVTLHVASETEALPTLIERSLRSLERWCRHARIPITFLAHGDEPRRIDRPLEIDGTLVHVAGRSRDGETDVLVGLHPEGPRGAFYNRGLLLYETTEVFTRIGAVAFKAVDGHLEHTLSRDDVRRDAHFARVLERVERTVHGPLTDRVHEASASLEGADWRALFDAAQRADLKLDPARLSVPLAVPIGGRSTWPLAHFPALRCWPASPALGGALAASGIPIAALSLDADGVRLQALARISGKRAFAADAEDALLERAFEPALSAVWPPLAELLGAAFRTPSSIDTARFAGAIGGWLTIGSAIEAGGTHTGTPSDLASDPFRLLARPPLLLNLEHGVTKAAIRALQRGAGAPTVAALLARAILAERKLATEATRTAVTERAIRAALEAS